MIFIKKRKNAPTPIETSLGILKGRDCIYLDKVYKKDRSYLFKSLPLISPSNKYDLSFL